MTELHEVSFKWPAGPSKVIFTGSFDDWAHSTELEKGNDGFTGTFRLPWDAKILYKYIVDDEWRVDPKEPQEPDEAGNINNVYISPPQPAKLPEEPKPSVSAVATKEPEVAAAIPEKESSPEVPAAVAEKTSMEGAKDTAASVVSYVASGLGAAFASVTGIDPINPQQIPLEDEKAKDVLEKQDAKKIEPTPIPDALAPVADEPIILNPLPAAYTASTATDVATDIEGGLPSAVPVGAEGKDVKEAVDKDQDTAVPTTDVPIPDAPEPYKEAQTTDPIPVPDAPEPCKETNGTLPGEAESTPKKVEETVEKAKDVVPDKAAEVVKKVKETVPGATDTVRSTTDTLKGTVKSATEKVKSTPPSSPTKKTFPSSSPTGKTGSIASSAADGTPKRKNRLSIFGKLKEALHGDKKKKVKAGSTSS